VLCADVQVLVPVAEDEQVDEVEEGLAADPDHGQHDAGMEEPVGLGPHYAPAGMSELPPNPALVERRIVSTAFLIAAAAAILQSVGHLTNFAFDADIEALNADGEQNVVSWASSMSTFAAGFFLFLPAVAAGALDRVTLALVGAITFFSLDDALSIHERLAERSIDVLDAEVSLQRIVWPIVYLPSLVFVFVMLWRMAQANSGPMGTAIKVGLMLLVAAVVAEVTSALYLGEGDEEAWANVVEVTLEEGAELAGWILIAGALAARAYVLAERNE
jgi:hypothetical protein